jgi:hypothetical protein
MKRVLLLALVLALAISAASLAEDLKTKRGQVQAMDLKQNVMIIIEFGQPVKFELTTDTKYYIGVAELQASSVAAKDNVEVEYKEENGKNIAVKVKVLRGAKGK